MCLFLIMSSGTLVFGETFSFPVLAWLGVGGGGGGEGIGLPDAPAWWLLTNAYIECALNVHVYIRRHKPLESISAQATLVAFFIFSFLPL